MQTDSQITDYNKTNTKFYIRKRSTQQFVSLSSELMRLSTRNFLADFVDCADAFNNFYSCMYNQLCKHFPERQITVTYRDPYFMTPYIKMMLRDKNRLMSTGKLERLIHWL